MEDKIFDYVFDRGCFHVLPIEKRPVYIREIKRILDDKGILFLKCSVLKNQDKKDHTSFQKMR
jgi:hypothetical protein